MASHPFLLILLAASLIVAFQVMRRRPDGDERKTAWNSDNTPKGGTEYGQLRAYFERITLLDNKRYDGFFVSAQCLGRPHFVQVSVGTEAAGRRVYEFDLPLTDWSRRYASAIEAEARRRGLTPVRTDGDTMEFLDVVFSDRAAHDAFAAWVVTGVFGIADSESFEITWG